MHKIETIQLHKLLYTNTGVWFMIMWLMILIISSFALGAVSSFLILCWNGQMLISLVFFIAVFIMSILRFFSLSRLHGK
jgi:hypothetical protein